MADSIKQLLPIRSACLANARVHLEAARALIALQSYNVAFECAILSLEEVGKAVILMMTHTRTLRRENDNPDWMDDHTKKIFWAVFSVVFGLQPLTKSGFDNLKDLALDLHQKRLQCAYVNYSDGTILHIDRDECERMIRLVENRLGMEEIREYKEELSKEDEEELRWFYAASENKSLRPIVWTWGSLDKLNEFKGDIHLWIRWLKDAVSKWEQQSRALMEQEMARKGPGAKEKMAPKWAARFHLLSGSHSIRPRTLSNWNKANDFLKMHPGGSRNELRIDVNLPKGVLLNSLWSHLFDMTTRVVLALNIGTTGFFWWYLPEYRTKFYDSIKDLDSQSEVTLEADAGLQVEWGNHAFTDAEANGFALIFGYLISRNHKELGIFQSYMRGLAMIARSDLLLPLQASALIEFRQAAQGFLSYLKDERELSDAIIGRLEMPDEHAGNVRHLVDLASNIGPTLPPRQVTITEVLQFKIYVDALIIKEAQANLARFAKTGKVRNSGKAKGAD